jgi:hypothetical protein
VVDVVGSDEDPVPVAVAVHEVEASVPRSGIGRLDVLVRAGVVLDVGDPVRGAAQRAADLGVVRGAVGVDVLFRVQLAPPVCWSPSE